MNQIPTLAKRLVLPALLLLCLAAGAQKPSAKHNYFDNLALDPVITVRNNSTAAVQGIRINYTLNADKIQTLDYNCPIAPLSSIQISLPRTYGSKRIVFEGWIAAADGKEKSPDNVFLQDAVFLLSPAGLNEKFKAAAAPLAAFPAPSPAVMVARQTNDKMSVLVSAFLDDRSRFSAFASTDKGKLWIKGEWDKNAGEEGGRNAAAFKDSKHPENSYKLLLSAKPVDERDVAKYPGIGTIADGAACKETVVAAEVYPNPFSTNVTISYSLQTAAVVNVAISNTQGQIIARPVDAVLKEKGNYTQQFNGANLPAGTYLCTVRYGSYEKTVKLVKK